MSEAEVRPAGKRGFTLIEVLVALLILAVGLLGLASLQLSASKSNSNSSLTTRALLIAQERMEELRTAPFDLVTESGWVFDRCQRVVQIATGPSTLQDFFHVGCEFDREDSDGDGQDDNVVLVVRVAYPAAANLVDPQIEIMSTRSSIDES